MFDGAGAILFLILVFGVGAPLVLYALVRAERDRSPVVDRASAERAARRDTDDEMR